MRLLAVEPGPAFSVADVHAGWLGALREVGAHVVNINFSARLDFYSQVALQNEKGEWRRALGSNDAVTLAAKGIEVAAYEFWPDVVLFTSCFFVPQSTLEVLRSRGHKVVILHTESPYEDEGQLLRAQHADLNILNDPTNIDRFPNAHYLGHRYDPAVHYRRPYKADLASDFCFVGTGFPSRAAFLEAVDWTGIDVALAGQWARVQPSSPLLPFVAHPIEHCIDNTDAMDLYGSTKASANLYRTEAERPELSAGWAMGPREVELAASETFFLRQPRPEGDELFPMLPTFDGPGDFGDKLRWWLRHDDERQEAARQARAAIEGSTFTAAAADLMRLLGL